MGKTETKKGLTADDLIAYFEDRLKHLANAIKFNLAAQEYPYIFITSSQLETFLGKIGMLAGIMLKEAMQ